MVLGTSNVSAVRFAPLNLVGALIWAEIFGGLGLTFGAGIEHVFGRLPIHIHLTAVVAVAVAMPVGVWTWRRVSRSLTVDGI